MKKEHFDILSQPSDLGKDLKRPDPLPADEQTQVPLGALSRNELIYVLAMHANTIAEYCDIGEGFTREEYARRLSRIVAVAEFELDRLGIRQ